MRGRLSLFVATCVAALCAVCMLAFIVPVTQDSAFGVPNPGLYQVTSLDSATSPAPHDSAGVTPPDEPCKTICSMTQPIPAMTSTTNPASTSARNAVYLCPMC